MRNVIRPILLAGAAALLPALAMGAGATGFIVVPTCDALVTNVDSDAGELYALKLTSNSGDRASDLMWDIRRKGETASDLQASLNGSGTWSYGDLWALSQVGSDQAFVFATFANGQILVDNDDQSVVDWGLQTPQWVGNSLPMGVDAGINLLLPGTTSQFDVRLTPAGAPKRFPAQAGPTGSATAASVNIAFGVIAEVNTNEFPVGSGCDIGGMRGNPRDATRGPIIGYNVYRIPGSAAAVPTRNSFDGALRTADDADGGWVYFVDLRTFNVTAADTTPGSFGTNSPSDTAPDDQAGLQNPDGRMYSGDEVLIFQDSANRAGVPRPRAAELAPVPGMSYWYAVQPVIVGTMAGYADVGFTSNDFFRGDHRMDLDGDGEPDAVSLDTTVAGGHNTPEFISPQAEALNGAQAGMGLTNGGMPLLSAPMFIDGASALPAFGQVGLSGNVTGNDVNVEFTTGLEKGNVLGYNVYRVTGDQRVRVNEQPILAQGSESNVYNLVDVAQRARGARAVDYMVEIVYSDGTASTMVGPFSVSLTQQPARRSR